MSYPLIISLALPAIMAILEIFVKTMTKKWKWILAGLTILSLAFAYYTTKDDAAENETMKATAKRSEQLLEEANVKITQQSKSINEGFANLKNQFSAAGGNNAALQSSLKSLEEQVNKFSTDSKNYFTQVIDLAAKNNKPVEGEYMFGTDNMMRVPIEYRNSIQIDRTNQFALIDKQNGQREGVTLIFNGYTVFLVPAQEYRFTQATGKGAALVYKGIENKKYMFYKYDL